MKRTDCWWCWYCFFFKQQQNACQWRVGLEFLVLPRSLEKGHLCLQTSLLSSSLSFSLFSPFLLSMFGKESNHYHYHHHQGTLAEVGRELRIYFADTYQQWWFVCRCLCMYLFVCLFPLSFSLSSTERGTCTGDYTVCAVSCDTVPLGLSVCCCCCYCRCQFSRWPPQS